MAQAPGGLTVWSAATHDDRCKWLAASADCASFLCIDTANPWKWYHTSTCCAPKHTSQPSPLCLYCADAQPVLCDLLLIKIFKLQRAVPRRRFDGGCRCHIGHRQRCHCCCCSAIAACTSNLHTGSVRRSSALHLAYIRRCDRLRGWHTGNCNCQARCRLLQLRCVVRITVFRLLVAALQGRAAGTAQFRNTADSKSVSIMQAVGSSGPLTRCRTCRQGLMVKEWRSRGRC